LDTKDQPDLQNDFRKRALCSGVALAPIAGTVFLASRRGAPEMYRGLTDWWAPLLLTLTSLIATVALVALWRRWFALARMAAIGQVTLILAGWGLAQYPNLVMPDVTLDNAHAPEITLRLLVLALVIGAFILLPSLFSCSIYSRVSGMISSRKPSIENFCRWLNDRKRKLLVPFLIARRSLGLAMGVACLMVGLHPILG
jgi:cytochrome d ubiquinol oxidase subunit II